MNESLFIFTLGPVQSFIAEARRASDLYLGSRILAEMAAAAAKAVPGTLVFPTCQACDRLAVPNRFVAVIGGPPSDAARLARQAAEAVWRRYADRARGQLERFGGKVDKTFDEIWDRQIARHVEYYWVACPLGSDYPKQYVLLQAALDARKRTRDFAASEEEGQKDSLSGMRAGLLTGRDKNSAAYWQRVAASPYLQNRSLLRSKGERLDAMGAIKRFGDDVDPFPSTSTVAAATFLLAAREHQEVLRDHEQAIEALGLYKIQQRVLFHDGLAAWPYDGDALFVATLTPQRLASDYGMVDAQGEPSVDPVRLEAAQESLRRLYKAVGAKPRLYYAVLKMDGDRMGQRIGQCRHQDEHRALSDCLAQFADEARRIVDRQFAGRLVYSGGDDVLALVPIEQAFPLAKALRDAFRQITGGGLSGGIAFSHHHDPLDRALHAARAAERRAKAVYRDGDRDALCVVALRRSGEILQVGTRWQVDDADPAALFDTLCTAFRPQGPLSSKLAFDALQELPAFADLHPGPAHASALKRIIKRHYDEKKDRDKRIEPDALATDLNRWAQDLGHDGPAELVRWLLLARFVAGGGEG
ncbi:MAG: type III-B CRISPR-associated protein Cas10/Cmr2 [Anaerolineae bacterium]|nr:type III-B CRISPR-associated protein Cas10/Cmr2 [Anaerolineae bacterium]